MAKKKSAILEKIETEVVKGAEDFVKGKIKKKIYRLGEISMLIVIGFILISFGVAILLANFYPVLSGGYNFLVLGVIFLLISFLLKI
jgi:hypothetical protein